MTSTLIAGPGGEPLTLAEAKAWCRLDTTDEDALLTALIAAARLHVENLTGRALLEQSWRLTLSCPKGRLVELPVIPVIAVTSAMADEDEIDVIVQGDSVLLPGDGYGALEIEYTAGYGAGADAVPADLKQALLGLVAYWFENRDAGTADAPVGIERLLAGYRRVRL